MTLLQVQYFSIQKRWLDYQIYQCYLFALEKKFILLDMVNEDKKKMKL